MAYFHTYSGKIANAIFCKYRLEISLRPYSWLIIPKWKVSKAEKYTCVLDVTSGQKQWLGQA